MAWPKQVTPAAAQRAVKSIVVAEVEVVEVVEVADVVMVEW